MITSYLVSGIITAGFFGGGRTPIPTAVQTELPYGSGDDVMSLMLSAGLYKALIAVMAFIVVGSLAVWGWGQYKGA